MNKKVPVYELQTRMKRFRERMNIYCSDWKIAVIFSKINIYYFTGTMQDGMLIIPKDDEAAFWVRRSYERALDESCFSNIKPMLSFRDAAAFMNILPDTVYLETEVVPLALYQRFQKYFPFKNVKSVDPHIMYVRSIKSNYEIKLMKQAGKIHSHILEHKVPEILEEGMSESELALKLFNMMVEEGHHGVARFRMFDTDMALGHICFGESSIYPTSFNGPGGNYGMSSAVPSWGSRERRLKKGDLVFIDIGCGVDGYHTDKTMTYMFGNPIPDEAISAHKKCVEIENQVASMLKPGAIPTDIYNTIMSSIDPKFIENFMGYGKRKVKFLGHGIGLHIDELPVIADGFSEPIEEGMIFALEPKKGVKGVGMVGIEDTFLVTKEGGKSITGNNPGLIPVS